MKHFIVQELVSKSIYEVCGDNSIKFIDNRIIVIIETLREYYDKPILINNWHNNGVYLNRGLRDYSCKIGSPLSQHKLGKAVDLNVVGVDSDTVRADIIRNQSEVGFNLIKRLETNVAWVHIDVKKTDSNKIYLFKP